jgi:hypothetical protein
MISYYPYCNNLDYMSSYEDVVLLYYGGNAHGCNAALSFLSVNVSLLHSTSSSFSLAILPHCFTARILSKKEPARMTASGIDSQACPSLENLLVNPDLSDPCLKKVNGILLLHHTNMNDILIVREKAPGGCSIPRFGKGCPGAGYRLTLITPILSLE